MLVGTADTVFTIVFVQVRNYEVYRLLEESIKAMLTSLPLVQVSTATDRHSVV